MSTRAFAHKFGCLVIVSVACFCLGCDSDSSDAELPTTTVAIVYQGNPLADVQIRLHESSGGPTLAQAITRADGKAVFGELPSPEPAKYFVSLESVGDGGWILDTRILDRQKPPLQLQPFATEPHQRMELPDRSVKPLSPNSKR